MSVVHPGQARSVLVTGGAGFIGLNLCQYWRAQYPRDHIVVLDALTYAAHPEAKTVLKQHHVDFVEGDICDASVCQHVMEHHHVTHVIHGAAESHVDRSIAGPDVFIKTNIEGTHILLKTARTYWEQTKIFDPKYVRFHHISTDEVYGSLSLDDPAFTERTPYDPRSPYSASKAASDHLVRAYGHTYGLPFTISNCSNNFGPYQHAEKLIPTVIRALVTQTPIPVYGNGQNIRDWLYVMDHCRGIDRIVCQGQVGETYLIGGRNPMDNLTLVKRLCAHFDRIRPRSSGSYTDLISFVTDRPGHDFRYEINPSKLEKLGFEVMDSFDAHLSYTVDWYLKAFSVPSAEPAVA